MSDRLLSTPTNPLNLFWVDVGFMKKQAITAVIRQPLYNGWEFDRSEDEKKLASKQGTEVEYKDQFVLMGNALIDKMEKKYLIKLDTQKVTCYFIFENE